MKRVVQTETPPTQAVTLGPPLPFLSLVSSAAPGVFPPPLDLVRMP